MILHCVSGYLIYLVWFLSYAWEPVFVVSFHPYTSYTKLYSSLFLPVSHSECSLWMILDGVYYIKAKHVQLYLNRCQYLLFDLVSRQLMSLLVISYIKETSCLANHSDKLSFYVHFFRNLDLVIGVYPNPGCTRSSAFLLNHQQRASQLEHSKFVPNFHRSVPSFYAP